MTEQGRYGPHYTLDHLVYPELEKLIDQSYERHESYMLSRQQLVELLCEAWWLGKDD